MVSNYVLDSSSLFTLFFLDSEENVRKILKESYVLDLTGYEIGSILTKGNDAHLILRNTTLARNTIYKDAQILQAMVQRIGRYPVSIAIVIILTI